MTDNSREGWIDHDGGPNPIPGQWANIRQRGYADQDDQIWEADFQQWRFKDYDPQPWDIIAYRLVTTPDDRGDGNEAEGVVTSKPDELAIAVEGEAYLLMKRGLFYRPNAMGYTGIRDHAGRYTKAEAESHADPISGVTAIALADAPLIAPKCFDDIAVKYLLDRLYSQEETIRATQALSVLGNWKDRDDQWSEEIAAVHPVNSTDPLRHKRFETAMEMVGNRHGKYELVGLVQWLLTERDEARARLSARQEGK